MLLQERINQEAQLTRSGQKETMQEVMEREEHTVNEIVRLKEDIEGLTHSLKRINFTSPTKGANSTLQESQAPTHEQRIPSPMKLIQDYQQQQEESYYRGDQSRSVDKPPIFKKGAQPQVSKASTGKYHQENNGSSSEDDELAIAQKWLNLRKQKIQKINEELNPTKPQQQELYESQRSEEPRKPNKIPTRGSPPRRFEDEGDEVYEQIQRQAPPKRLIPKAGMEELNEEDLRAINRDWVKNSPGQHGMRSDGFTSAQKAQQQSMADTNNFFKKRETSSASKTFNINLASPQRSGLVDINTMNMEDLIQLKQVLDHRLSSESRQHHRQLSQPQLNPLEYSLGSGIKHIEKSQLSFISPTSQDFFEQPTYADTTKSASSIQYSAIRDVHGHGGQPQQNYFARNSGSGIRGAEINSYERRGEYIDPSLMRDFDSIAYSNPHMIQQPQRQIQSPIKILAEEVPAYSVSQQRMTGGFPEHDDDTRSEVDENLYEQKLQEFLKVRERMLKTNKIRDQGVDIEDLLKSTVIESKRSNISQSATVGGPTRYSGGHHQQQQQYINSPPSVKSVGRPENARLSSERDVRDWMNNQDLIRQALQENIPLFANKKNSDSGFFKAHKLDSEAKTPDYGYTRSQASVKSLKYQESEPANDYEEEELEQLTDDFYDDKLFDLVEDIEQKESNKSESFRRSEVNTATSRPRNSEVDHEFNNLFNTVRMI